MRKKEWGKGKGIKDQRSDVGKSCGEVTFIQKLERWKERKQAQKERMFPAGGSMVRLGKGQSQAPKSTLRFLGDLEAGSGGVTAKQREKVFS